MTCVLTNAAAAVPVFFLNYPAGARPGVNAYLVWLSDGTQAFVDPS